MADAEHGTARAEGHALDHMLRGGVEAQLELTRLADMKANIIITIASLVVTFTLPWYTVQSLALSVLLLDCFGIGAILFAVLASKPRVPKVRPGITDPRDSAFSLLFFGTISTLSSADYEQAVISVGEKEGGPYQQIARNMHGMGSVLSRKYYFLNLAYLSFIGGILFAIIPLLLGVQVSWFGGQ